MKQFLAIALILAPMAAGAAPSLKIGEPFPILSLPLSGNEDEKSSVMGYRGRKLMLHLFASW